MEDFISIEKEINIEIKKAYINNIEINKKIINRLYRSNIVNSVLVGTFAGLILTGSPFFLAYAYMGYQDIKTIRKNFKSIDELYLKTDEYYKEIEQIDKKIKVYKKESN